MRTRICRFLWLSIITTGDVRTVRSFTLVATVRRRHHPASNTGIGPVGTTAIGFQKGLFVDAAAVMDAHSLETLQTLVNQRAAARYAGDYVRADALKCEIEAVELPVGFQLVIEDLPYRSGGGSTFRLEYQVLEALPAGPTVMQLAHMALGMVASHADRNAYLPPEKVDGIADRAKFILRRWSRADRYLQISQRDEGDEVVSLESFRNLQQQPSQAADSDASYWRAVEEQLSGRKAADAAFWFALAGVTDEELFDLLTRVSTKEVRRFGSRQSCRLKDLLAICDKLAAAGIMRSDSLEQAVICCMKDKVLTENHEKDASDLLCLHGDSCALMIWKFSTRQRKQRSFLRTAAKHWETNYLSTKPSSSVPDGSASRTSKQQWSSLYADVTRPLVVDLGCGMGLSLLGLANGRNEANSEPGSWIGYNFLGVDLSPLAIGYANGIASRWGLQDSLQFVVESAETILQDLGDYPGRVETILIQFPTPYRFHALDDEQHSQSRNLQLPASASDGFMVTGALLNLAHRVLTKGGEPGQFGRIIFQSNCEDVALWVHDISHSLGFHAIVTSDFISAPADNITQRTSRWIASGGNRAVGPVWSARSLLPRNAWTETEIACGINNTPIHRFILKPKEDLNVS